MANRLYNKQVSPKGYKKGGSVRDTRKTEQMIGASISSKREKGRTRKMGGGMMMQRPMMQRPMMEKGGRTKKMTEAQKQAAKKTGKKVMKAAKVVAGLALPGLGASMLGKKVGEKLRAKKKMGGSLKPVQPNQKGLSKLPTEVRNKMGYMKKGGEVKKLMTPKERAEYVKKAKVSLGATAKSLMDKNQPKKRDRLFQKYGK